MDAKTVYCILGMCWHRKPETWAEWAYHWLPMMRETSNDWTYDLIYVRTTPFIAIALMVVGALIGYLITRGRPSRRETPAHALATTESTTDTANASHNSVQTNVYVHTTMQPPPGTPAQVPDRDATAMNSLPGPSEFTGKSDVKCWFTRLKCYLKDNVSPDRWLMSAIRAVNESCLKNIENLDKLIQTATRNSKRRLSRNTLLKRK